MCKGVCEREKEEREMNINGTEECENLINSIFV